MNNDRMKFMLQAGSMITEVSPSDLPSIVSLRLDEIKSVYARWGQSFSDTNRQLAEDRLNVALENATFGDYVLHGGNSKLVLTIVSIN